MHQIVNAAALGATKRPLRKERCPMFASPIDTTQRIPRGKALLTKCGHGRVLLSGLTQMLKEHLIENYAKYEQKSKVPFSFA